MLADLDGDGCLSADDEELLIQLPEPSPGLCGVFATGALALARIRALRKLPRAALL